jgi:hypothetical protein
VNDTDEPYSGPQFTSSRGNEWPANFTEWPRSQQRDYVSGFFLRRDLIRRTLLLARGDVPETIPDDYTLDKSELASIYLALKETTA